MKRLNKIGPNIGTFLRISRYELKAELKPFLPAEIKSL